LDVGSVAGDKDVAGETKRRGFFPSCHQKRTLNLANHLVKNVFADVAHRQYIFTIPKRFRLYFRYNRDLLSELARCALNDSEEVLLGRPVAEAKIHRDSPGGNLLYDAEHPEPLPSQKWKALPTERTITRNFEVFDPLDFLAHRSCHIHAP
jgi:hypothetical protein